MRGIRIRLTDLEIICMFRALEEYAKTYPDISKICQEIGNKFKTKIDKRKERDQ